MALVAQPLTLALVAQVLGMLGQLSLVVDVHGWPFSLWWTAIAQRVVEDKPVSKASESLRPEELPIGLLVAGLVPVSLPNV